MSTNKNINNLKIYKYNKFSFNKNLENFFYELFYYSINKKSFLPLHISFNNRKKTFEYSKMFIEYLNNEKINYINVIENINEKKHYHIILLESCNFEIEKKYFKKQKIKNILQFYNILEYITKEEILYENIKKYNIIFNLNKNNFNFIYNNEILNFINLYVKFY